MRIAGTIISIAAAATAAATLAVSAPAAQAATASRTIQYCTTKTAALTGWSVYRVCLTANDSWDGSRVNGYVAGLNCNVFLPTGAGWACRWETHGSYWNAAAGAHEDWLNFALVYISPFLGYQVYYQNCVYVRIDTKPSGATSFKAFTNQNLPIGTHC
ncbi:MAG: hypothetical protein QOE36_1514 [Gaiellaceae bacterium]|jgi:hypothetical protein|nr:hypothetical protein [Gaiellaceae bacterium]